jgi:hypothetical protein
MSNISTALAIQEACSHAVYSDESMQVAAEIAQQTDFNPAVLQLLMKYTAILTAGVATNMTQILMSESDFNYMMSEMRELGAFEGIEDEN